MKTFITFFACIVFSIATMAQTPAVTITPGTTTITTVQASFAKNATCHSYYILMSTAAEMAQWATMFGVPVDSLVRQWGIHCYSDTTNTWTAMAPSTEYTIYALPADAGNVFYPMQTELATTPQAVEQACQRSPLKFSISPATVHELLLHPMQKRLFFTMV